MFKGKFKTAFGQKEIPLDIVVVGDLRVGQLVTLVAAASGKPAYLQAATTAATATHIIAQSDMTMEYGHVPVENRDYKYSDVVAKTVADASSVSSTSASKKVAVFAIIDKEDVISYEV